MRNQMVRGAFRHFDNDFHEVFRRLDSMGRQLDGLCFALMSWANYDEGTDDSLRNALRAVSGRVAPRDTVSDGDSGTSADDGNEPNES